MENEEYVMTDHQYNAAVLSAYMKAKDIISQKMPNDEQLAKEIMDEFGDWCYTLTGKDPEKITRK